MSVWIWARAGAGPTVTVTEVLGQMLALRSLPVLLGSGGGSKSCH
jgi:hypothetical protein